MLFILLMGLILTFRLGRFFLPRPKIARRPTIYPDAAVMAKLYTITAHDQKTQRLINRLWTRIKTGR